MYEIERLIIIVLGSWDTHDGWYTLHTSKYTNCNNPRDCIHPILYVNYNESVNISENNNNPYDLVFIRENYYHDNINSFKKSVGSIIDNDSNKQAAIAVHRSSKRLNDVQTVINDLRHAPSTIEFSREEEGNKIWTNLEPLIDCIVKNGGNYNELFDKLWQCLAPKLSEVAHTLRAEILTPFIPFHLYYQLKRDQKKEWNGILNQAHTKIKKITDGKLLKELLELKTDVNDDEVKKVKEQEAFAELKEYFSHDISECMDKDCNDDIQKFANDLEEVVNSIENESQ
jgi:hypothetical protein